MTAVVAGAEGTCIMHGVLLDPDGSCPPCAKNKNISPQAADNAARALAKHEGARLTSRRGFLSFGMKVAGAVGIATLIGRHAMVSAEAAGTNFDTATLTDTRNKAREVLANYITVGDTIDTTADFVNTGTSKFKGNATFEDGVAVRYGTDADFTEKYVHNASGGYLQRSDGALVLPSGLSDYGAALTAAGAVATVSGGSVILPPGTNLPLTTTWTIYPNVHYHGHGVQSTILKLGSAANVDMAKTYGYDALAGTDPDVTYGPSGAGNWSINNLTLDGNKANNATSGAGLKIYGYAFRLHNVTVRFCREQGIISEWATGTMASTSTVSEDQMTAFLANVQVHNCSGNGVEWAGPHDSEWVNCKVWECASAGYGIWMKEKGVAAVFKGVHVWGWNHAYSWRIDASATLIACQGEGADYQLWIHGNDINVIGGTWFGASGKGASLGTAQNGIRWGESGVWSPAGCRVQTTLRNISGTGIVFSADNGQNIIDVIVQTNTDGAVTPVATYSGTVATSTQFRLHAHGTLGVTSSTFRHPYADMWLRRSTNAVAGLALVGDYSGGTSPRLFFWNSVTAGNTGFGIYHNGSGLALTFGAQPGATSGTTAWELSASGHLITGTNNAYDIGSSSLAPRNIYLAGDLYCGGAIRIDGTRVLTNQQAAIANLTDSTGGTPGATLAAVSGSGADATINNNFASLKAKLDALGDMSRAHGFIAA